MASRSNNEYKLGRLLEELRKRPMTHKEIVQFLLSDTGVEYDASTRKYYDSTLYGSSTREGVLERFCRQRRDGRWQLRAVNRRIEAPFTPVRILTNSSGTATQR